MLWIQMPTSKVSKLLRKCATIWLLSVQKQKKRILCTVEYICILCMRNLIEIEWYRIKIVVQFVTVTKIEILVIASAIYENNFQQPHDRYNHHFFQVKRNETPFILKCKQNTNASYSALLHIIILFRRYTCLKAWNRHK